MHKKLIVLMLLVFIFSTTYSIDSLKVKKEVDTHPNVSAAICSYSTQCNGIYSQGNNNKTVLTYLGNFTVKKGLYFNLNHNFSYTKLLNKPSQRDFFVLFSQQLKREKKVYILNSGIVEGSQYRGINFRWLLGPGVGYHFIRKDSIHLSVSNCILYEDSYFINNRFENSPNITTYSIKTIRSSVRIKYQRIFKKIKIKSETYLMPSILDIHNFRLRSISSIILPITRKFSFNYTIQDTYESIVLQGKAKNDLQLTLGLNLDL